MSKLKVKSQPSPKLTANVPAQDNYINFTYKFLTDDKDYTFDKLKNIDRKENVIARQGLDELLYELSRCRWVDILGRSKYQLGGFETMPAGDVSESVVKKCGLKAGAKLLSFRFCGDRYRLLGYKFTNSNTLYILGLDFRFSAYDHGS